MSEYTVTGTKKPLRFGLSGVESVKQNIRIICSTYKMSVPFDRDFGMETDTIDRPYETAQALQTARIMAAISANEPRVVVTSIDFVQDKEDAQSGRLVPLIKFTLAEEAE